MVLLSLRKLVRFRNFLRTWLPCRLSLVGADIQTRRVSQNPNTREPKKEISWLRTHGTLPSRSHLLAFLGLFLFLNLLTSPSCGDRPPSLVFFFSSFSHPLRVATDHLPWSSSFLSHVPLFFGNRPALADSTASTYVPLYVACQKNNPSLS